MRCPNCERDNPEDARFCAGCGSPLSSEIACTRCGRLNPPDAAFCNGCSQQLGGAPATAEGAMNRAPTPVAAPQPTSFANGRYTVKRFLGEGGKKKVYLVHDASLDRDVAFALIKTEGLDAAARERITREAQAMGRLGTHPHIVTVFDIGQEGDQPFLVLPLLPGGDVESVIEQAPEHKLPLEQAIKIAIETAAGLAFAHERHIIHRDIKPGNVWLATDGRAQVGDWGLAVATDRTRLTQAGMMVGTVSYMPPEQAMGGEITLAATSTLWAPCSMRWSAAARPSSAMSRSRSSASTSTRAGRAHLAPARLPAGSRDLDPAPAGKGPVEEARFGC